MKASSLTTHVEGVHGVYRSNVINKYLIDEDHEPVHYEAKTFTKRYFCPVEGCNYGLNNELIITPYQLQSHFGYQHLLDTICIPCKGSLARCDLCNMQVDETNKKKMARHQCTETCIKGHKSKLSNLAKAHIFWARISQVLKDKNMSSKVCGMFYKALIQAVLLYRSML